MSATAKWGDLGPRVVSGVVMAALGFGLLYLGGVPLLLGLAAIGGLAVWELHRMLGGQMPRMAGGLAATGVAAACAAQVFAFATGDGLWDGVYLSPWIVPLIGLAIWGGVQSVPPRHRWVFTSYGLLVLFAVAGLFYLRILHGWIFVLFVAGVVVATDIAGYFAGRFLGGPKFWPRVSPKKTWSGTVAGWIAAALMAWALLGWVPAIVLGIAPLLSLASQMGDAAESAIKRRAGFKDTSTLIPGHGGVLDRFDAMIGASAVATLVMVIGRGWVL
ncbi:MAG: phosphatidate cytidylyltransferase [Rhodobacteraceae bacterium CG17_big_fil_post_rev_8_21_14_2_50_65_11]|nr:MAG: phosphatidate cytidylyltransferase [Rhodobacteraceae bacterium CG17_big_fil_post_rev_8_21_14_2_50_65_11]